MALAGGPQAHDKPQPPSRRLALVGMRHDRRVEQSCGPQRVFAGEQRADEQLPRVRERAWGKNVALHSRVVLAQRHFDIKVPGAELAMHSPQLLLAQDKGTVDDGGDAPCAGGNEGADDDPRAFRQQRKLVTTDADGIHEVDGSGCSAYFISARARWNASDDSAPWFSLTRSRWSPSPQPPVLES